ncbi:MAG: helix-turn-helix domain-containing protein [Candidatus Micrarchaeota archaeon]
MNAPSGPGDSRTRPPRRGRPRVGRDAQSLAKVVELYFCDRLSVRKVASMVGLSHMTVYRMLNEIDISAVGM